MLAPPCLKLPAVARTTPRSSVRSAVLLHATKKTFGTFDDLLASSNGKPVLVDFYATWCGPCQMQSPILAEVASLLDGKLTVAKVDTDKYGSIASRFNIAGLPTLILFKNGKAVDRVEGLMTKEQLLARLNPQLH